MQTMNSMRSALVFSTLLLSLALCPGCKAGDLPLDNIKLPPGFHVAIFAEVPNARSMTLSPKGTVFVGNRGGDKVYAVVDADRDGKADNVYTIASGLDSPNGVAFRDGALYPKFARFFYKVRRSGSSGPVIVTTHFAA